MGIYNTKRILILPIAYLLLLVLFSCESEKKFPPKGYLPSESQSTEKLEASYFWTPQDKITSSYWKQANYLTIELLDLEKTNLYEDGNLNMTGTFRGIKDFNKGKEAGVKLKAGYDDEYLYILVEWKDTTSNASFKSWLWDGPSDSKKEDSTSGWTSQRNQDTFTLLFDNESNQSKNAWKWSLALTAPFDMAQNLRADASGNLIVDSSNFSRNSLGNTSRSGPAFEWNGQRQEILLADGTKKLLDPGYYLLNDFKMPFVGNVDAGQYVFNVKAECAFCHGENGNGESDGSSDGGSLATPVTNRTSHEALLEYIGSEGHDGGADHYFGKIRNNTVDQENLITFLRAIAGVPGHNLIQPENDPDIKAWLNIGIGTIDTKNSIYQVLLRRKLTTDNPEDIQFSPTGNFTFSIRFSDNDDLNYVGASQLELIFKSNEL